MRYRKLCKLDLWLQGFQEGAREEHLPRIWSCAGLRSKEYISSCDIWPRRPVWFLLSHIISVIEEKYDIIHTLTFRGKLMLLARLVFLLVCVKLSLRKNEWRFSVVLGTIQQPEHCKLVV